MRVRTQAGSRPERRPILVVAEDMRTLGRTASVATEVGRCSHRALHIVSPSFVPAALIPSPIDGIPVDLWTVCDEVAAETLDAARAEVTSRGCLVYGSHLVSGSPLDAAAETACSIDAGVIVTDRGRWHGIVATSLTAARAHHLVRLSRRPVLLAGRNGDEWRPRSVMVIGPPVPAIAAAATGILGVPAAFLDDPAWPRILRSACDRGAAGVSSLVVAVPGALTRSCGTRRRLRRAISNWRGCVLLMP